MDNLGGIELFGDLSAPELAALAQRCAWRRYHARQEILGRRDETTDVYFVVAGSVRAVSYSLTGREVTYRDIEAGGMFGEFAAIDGEPRSSSVVANADSVVAAMSSELFWQTLRTHPAVAARLLKRMTRTARQLTERVFEYSALAVRSRLYAELLRLARDHTAGDNTAVIEPAPTHADIASRIGSRREEVTRELGALARAGLIERHRRRLVIVDVQRLRRLVAEIIEE